VSDDRTGGGRSVLRTGKGAHGDSVVDRATVVRSITKQGDIGKRALAQTDVGAALARVARPGHRVAVQCQIGLARIGPSWPGIELDAVIRLQGCIRARIRNRVSSDNKSRFGHMPAIVTDL